MNKTYRFKFTSRFADLLNNFAKIHEFDERSDFKEAWKSWCLENYSIINHESILHEIKGYKGDINTKMYNSVRYYYRKKSIDIKTSHKRKSYSHIDKNILLSIDHFILQNSSLKPSLCFDLFCETFHFRNNNSLNDNNFKLLLKKTFKNRFYFLTKKYE